ncbi:MAG TPA: NAD-dependent epimerase/dehydratase family protein [Pyrinomonadaceae bacterium]|nr:NAD-dependent epimerase/dehydratase family protein [Pyrinomonadaceae bacterium]
MAAEVSEQTEPRGETVNAAGASFLVTGAHGFIGAWVTKRLLDAGARVHLFDRDADPRRLLLIMGEEEVARTTVVTGDITDARALPPVFEKFGVEHVIHLAGLQVPTCRADPHAGALVNVVGTVNVFEAARLSGRVKRIVYASSAAVYGACEDSRAVSERDEPQPSTHYGVFKRANEGNARVYHLDHGISSVGLRPLTVYGVGRDTGLTSDPTKAMKAAVVGRPFHIRFGGRTDFQYVADTADTFIRAAVSELEGAHVFNLHGETVAIADVVSEIERARPEARGQITFDSAPLAIPSEFNDAAVRRKLGPLPATPLAEGVRATIERFAQLQSERRLDTSDLEQ